MPVTPISTTRSRWTGSSPCGGSRRGCSWSSRGSLGSRGRRGGYGCSRCRGSGRGCGRGGLLGGILP